ncbi:hypothetical protein M405DRAFT_831320 [Rhizopogon salebrosus TDB-379]|nr:hypothetical protein M405DRAFT_831320 [Rhizopogon salebrosus TDB-379]
MERLDDKTGRLPDKRLAAIPPADAKARKASYHRNALRIAKLILPRPPKEAQFQQETRDNSEDINLNSFKAGKRLGTQAKRDRDANASKGISTEREDAILESLDQFTVKDLKDISGRTSYAQAAGRQLAGEFGGKLGKLGNSFGECYVDFVSIFLPRRSEAAIREAYPEMVKDAGELSVAAAKLGEKLSLGIPGLKQVNRAAFGIGGYWLGASANLVSGVGKAAHPGSSRQG